MVIPSYPLGVKENSNSCDFVIQTKKNYTQRQVILCHLGVRCLVRVEPLKEFKVRNAT
jgi:hypothetical protein